MKKRLFISLFMSIIICLSAEEITPQIEYTGKLYDSTGTGITASVDLVFSLYNEEYAGISEYIWQESHTQVNVTDGEYSVLLGSQGSSINITDFKEQLWLGIEYNESEATPRHKFTVTPYAIHAEQATDVAGQTIHPASVFTGDIITYQLSAVSIDADAITIKGQDVLTDNNQLKVNGVSINNQKVIESDTITNIINIKNINNIEASSINAANYTLNGSTGSIITKEGGKRLLNIDVIRCPDTLSIDNALNISGLLNIDTKHNLVGSSSNLHFRLYNTNSTLTEYGGIRSYITNNTTGNESGGMAFYTTHNGTSGQRRMTITDEGNVGIGTDTPAATLDVNGAINATGDIDAAALGVTGNINAAALDVTGNVNAATLNASEIVNATELAGPWVNSGTGYIQLGNVQICWGTKISDENGEIITFPVPFTNKPTVTASIPRTDYYCSIGISNTGPTKTNFTAYVRKNDGTEYTGDTTINWIAIGTWK